MKIIYSNNYKTKSRRYLFKRALSETVFHSCTAQKIEFSMKNLFRKCDQIRRKLRIWSHLLNKYLMENSIFCVAVLQNSSSKNFTRVPEKHLPRSHVLVNLKASVYSLT